MKFAIILASVLLVFGILGVAFGAEDTVQASVTVLGAISVTADETLVFGELNPGETSSTVTLGIDVVSNAPYTVYTRANSADFVDGSKKIAVGYMVWYDGASWVSYTTSDVQIASGNGPGAKHDIDHKLKVPSTAEAGSYSVGITITAIQT